MTFRLQMAILLSLLSCFLMRAGPSLAAQERTARTEKSPSTSEAATLLQRAQEVLRLSHVGQSILHFHTVAAAEQNYQSDRTYPPFFSAMQVNEEWFSPETGADRLSAQATFPGVGPTPPQVVLSDATRAFRISGKDTKPTPTLFPGSRFLNPWAVVRDWATAGDAHVAGHEIYRDYERIILLRETPSGEQRLFLDPKSGFPVKLDLDEKHYLWGQRHIEYLYTNWTLSGGVMVPGSSFRLADGEIEISQTTGGVEITGQSAAPEMTLPDGPTLPPDSLPLFLQPIDPKIVQVGPRTYLLSNPGYTEAVTQASDEVFLFDATQSEERSKKDAEAIAKLFPGYKRLTVVVTDLAWPHVAGVRYWVANGATIVAHKAARGFLQRIVDRRWTQAPDLLEQHRGTTRLTFVGIDGTTPLAGAISLHPIDGIGSEVALMAFVKPDHFLWASDYIQTVDEPSAYASEVWHAVQRDGLHPERTAAEHLPLTPWTRIEELEKQMENDKSSSSK